MDDSDLAAADRAYIDAMRAEVLWAPLHFGGWGHYEQARPTMPDETIEVIARWPDKGYTLQYRPLLGELTEARQYPIDHFPTVSVLGRVDEAGLTQLRSSATTGDDSSLARFAREIAIVDRTIPTEPPIRTGSSIPDHEEIPVHYEPLGGNQVGPGRLVNDDHPPIAYAVAGQWNLRFGGPVGLTPTGLLVFRLSDTTEIRMTVEHPVIEPVRAFIRDARVGVYRYDGLGGWRQSATVVQVDELERLRRDLTVPLYRTISSSLESQNTWNVARSASETDPSSRPVSWDGGSSQRRDWTPQV